MISIENKSKKLYEKIDWLIYNHILENKQIILFGINISSYATKNYLEKKGFRVSAYIDNSKKKVLEINQMLSDMLIRHISLMDYKMCKDNFINAYSPEDIHSIFGDNVSILIASKYYPSMCRQLESLGYIENKHFFKTLDFYGIDEILKEDSEILNMEELNRQQIRKIQLEITLYLKDICRKNGLKYFMTGGTLLGAVRHKGYIPWDDDIDITIPMPDYKRLIELIIDDDKYDVFTVYNEPDKCSNFYMRIMDRNTIMKLWEYPFLTTSGVSIDVFPLIGLPEKMDETRTFFNQVRHLNTMYANSYMNVEDNDFVPAYRDRLRNSVIDLIEKYNYYGSKNTGYILSKYWERDIMPRKIYDSSIEMMFEDIKLAAPVGYDEYLERIFGNYMQLPSEKERYVTHNYRVFKVSHEEKNEFKL